MEREFPKNVKQIGNVCGDPKIYVEDYVDTYLNQLCGKAEEAPVAAVLTGERVEQNEQNVVYVSGALRIREIAMVGNEPVIPDEAWERACDEKELFFEGQEIVGWCLVEGSHSPAMQKGICRMHDRLFPQENTLFIWKGAVDGEESYYVRKYDELMEIGGHYIFYEKNPSMQNFLVTSRKKIGVSPSEVVEDRAAKDFRTAIKERLAEKEQRRSSRFAYVLSLALVLAVLGIGISTMNNYDKMEAVQSSLDTLSESVGQAQASDAAEGRGGKEPEENGDGQVDEEEEKEDQSETASVTDQVSESAPSGAEGETESGQEAQTETLTPVDEASESIAAASVDSESPSVYTVCKGDTLDSISLRFYGTASKVDEICAINGLNDGNLIIIGQELRLP